MRRRLALQAIDVAPQLANGGVEVGDVTKGACLHDPSFHGGQYELRELAPLHGVGDIEPGRLQAFIDGLDPRAEILRQPLAHRFVGFVQFQREAADRAAVEAIGVHQRTAIAGEQREYAVDRLVHAGPRGVEQHRADAAVVQVQYRCQQVGFTREKVIQAAAVDLGRLQHIRNAGGVVALLPEQLHGGEDEAGAGIRWVHDLT